MIITRIIKPILFLLLFCSQLLNAQEKQKDCCSARIDSMMKILYKQKEDSNRVKTLLAIAWDKFNLAWTKNGDYESSIDFANQALALSQKLKFPRGIGRANSILGTCYELKADYSRSIKYHFAALNVSLEMRNNTLSRLEYYDLGKIYNRLANYPEALKNYFAAYEVSKKMKDDYWVADIISRIGLVYFNQGNFNQAVKYFDNAFSMAEKIKYDAIMADVWGYRGNMSLSLGKYDEAIQNFQNGLNIYEKHPVKSYLATFNGYLGKAYMNKAENTSDSLSTLSYYRDAIQYLQKALVSTQEYGGKEKLIGIYSLLSEAYRGIHDYKNALTYSDLYHQAQDSSHNRSVYMKIADLKIKYETEKAATEMKINQEKERIMQDALLDKRMAKQKLEDEKKISEEKNKYDQSISEEKVKQEKLKAEKLQTKNMLLMGLGLVIVTSIFLIFYLRQRNERKRAVEKAEAVHKMAELEMQSLRSQLNPHFMFNSLNALQTLILSEESDKSQSYLAQFSKMLRMLLENADKPFISLQKEIEFLQLYLGLEEMRVPDLQYSISTDPGLNTEQTLIPNMILQPYVENAIWHGLSHKESDKKVQIRIYRKNGSVNCEVEDNGIGRKKAEELKSLFRKQHQSKGMELLTKRFKLLNEEYGSNIEAIITDLKKNENDSGTLVTIKIPVMQSV